MLRRLAIPSAVAISVAAAVAASGAGGGRPHVASCTLFPANNPWNQRVDGLPVASDSATIVRSIGVDKTMHADFGSGLYNGGPIGIPYITVAGSQPKSRVKFDYASESDRGPYPIPRNVPIEGGRGSRAGSGAIWSLRSNHLRPTSWTSADAAGLPILPGLARYDEASRGAIDHALRFTVSRTRKGFVYPARHYASSDTDPSLPPMGLRLRLKASFDISRFPRQSRVVLTALKRYGMIVADNGSDWYVSGAPNRGWNNDDLHSLGGVKGSSFEVVDTSSLPQPGR
jgi:hypothetical protein